MFNFATASHAATVGFDLTIDGSTNVPTISITNTSDTAEIVSLDMFIGDTRRNFDIVTVQGSQSDPVGSSDVVDGDGGLRFDVVEFAFTSFEAGETFVYTTDIDSDTGNSPEDYTEILVPNGYFEVAFSSGEVLRLTFTAPLSSSGNSFSVTSAVVPLPAALPLLMLGLGGLAFLRRRKSAGAALTV